MIIRETLFTLVLVVAFLVLAQALGMQLVHEIVLGAGIFMIIFFTIVDLVIVETGGEIL